jgi:hypothetical protein
MSPGDPHRLAILELGNESPVELHFWTCELVHRLGVKLAGLDD